MASAAADLGGADLAALEDDRGAGLAEVVHLPRQRLLAERVPERDRGVEGGDEVRGEAHRDRYASSCGMRASPSLPRAPLQRGHRAPRTHWRQPVATRAVAMVVVDLERLAQTAADGAGATLEGREGIHLGRGEPVRPAPLRGA